MAIDTTAPKLGTWLGDEQIPDLHADSVTTHDIDKQWLARTHRTAPARPTIQGPDYKLALEIVVENVIHCEERDDVLPPTGRGLRARPRHGAVGR
ncbi:hypothetical protein ACH4VM_37150 [Streptomyces sp. NPDC020792]|uniref:hypothetical protein n=1 Tax=Streptomyces sp. NPDC020792 TaxID=3365089 RepID=UPI0037AA38FE